MANSGSNSKYGLPSTNSVTDSNLKRILDGMILELKRLRLQVEINNSK